MQTTSNLLRDRELRAAPSVWRLSCLSLLFAGVWASVSAVEPTAASSEPVPEPVDAVEDRECVYLGGSLETRFGAMFRVGYAFAEEPVFIEVGYGGQSLSRAVEDSGLPDMHALLERSLDFDDYLGLAHMSCEWFAAYSAILAQAGITPNSMREADSRVIEAFRLLNEHPLDRRLNRARLAKQVHLSVKQLERLFVPYAGVSIQRYFERRRLEYAQRARSALTLKGIAWRVGFGQAAGFSHWLRRHTSYSAKNTAKGIFPILPCGCSSVRRSTCATSPSTSPACDVMPDREEGGEEWDGWWERSLWA